MLCLIIMLFNIHNKYPCLSVTSIPICYRCRLLSPALLLHTVIYPLQMDGLEQLLLGFLGSATYYLWSMSSSMTTSPDIARDYCHQDFPNKVNSPAIFNIFMFLHKLYACVPQINIYTVSNSCLHYWSCARYRKSKLEWLCVPILCFKYVRIVLVTICALCSCQYMPIPFCQHKHIVSPKCAYIMLPQRFHIMLPKFAHNMLPTCLNYVATTFPYYAAKMCT